MMMTEMDIETSVYYVLLTRLIAREDFIKFTRRESTKTYIDNEEFKSWSSRLWLYLSIAINCHVKDSSQNVGSLLHFDDIDPPWR
jgi:hypothetical protein